MKQETEKKARGISRRDFLKGSAVGMLGVATAGLLGCASANETAAATTAATEALTEAATEAATQAAGIADASVRQRRVAPALDAILHVELSFPMAREIEGNRHKNHWA